MLFLRDEFRRDMDRLLYSEIQGDSSATRLFTIVKWQVGMYPEKIKGGVEEKFF